MDFCRDEDIPTRVAGPTVCHWSEFFMRTGCGSPPLILGLFRLSLVGCSLILVKAKEGQRRGRTRVVRGSAILLALNIQ